MATELPQPQGWALPNWGCSSSSNLWFYPRRALGQCHCYPACSAWPLEWVRRPGRGKVSQHCRTLWLRSPDTACSEPRRSLQPSVWEPLSSLPGLFYYLQRHTAHVTGKNAASYITVWTVVGVHETDGSGGACVWRLFIPDKNDFFAEKWQEFHSKRTIKCWRRQNLLCVVQIYSETAFHVSSLIHIHI